MKKKIKAQYIGEQIGDKVSELIPGEIYHLNLHEDEPNVIYLHNYNWRIDYDSVYDFFKEWKLN